ncbi:mucin-2-like isoform X2 [Echeneis naucrates]|uniref:mucin-2-like isoform X2 n=1 Tax=Echeneis naucrates TaxID=173247 RepID=UPI0011139F25|nr:mucin-2-like isoform X2 [Echeneis naucrates]
MRWRRAWLCFLASVAIVSDVQAGLSPNHVNSICSTWGRGNFKTFDGAVYQFPGMCEYNLASDCHETYSEFSVHMKREERDGNPTVSYLVVTINDLSFNVNRQQTTINDEKINLPYYNSGVEVENYYVYIKLHSKVGVTVMWNYDDAVMVEVHQDYANRTCGLCGDFNGFSVQNEFVHDDRQISPIEFGNNYKVHLPNYECEDPDEEDEDPQAAQNVTACKQTCDKIFNSEDWSPCTRLIDPQPYIQACAQDMCGCNNTDDCVCSTYSEFSRQCSHAGGNPPNWRTSTFCEKVCPFNMIFQESGSPCMNTCSSQDRTSLCEEHKMDGCFCPPGTVFDDVSKRGCIALSECQCKHNRIYNSSEVYWQEERECTCLEGKWVCKTHDTPATCAVEEGSHITTFDGKTYTFHGDCFYTLAKVESKDAASPNFTITVQLVRCAHQEFDTCLKSLKILLNNDRNNVLTFTSDGKVKQNTQTISLPYQAADITIFKASSFHIMFQTTFGLQIQIQHVPIMQVYVSLTQAYRTKTRGLCGNYNKVMYDEMKTPQGIVEGTAVLFANSWKANTMCSDRKERLEDPCSLSLENERYAQHWCALLISPNSTFTQCHSVVDPELYYKRCTYASCNCDKSEACLCAVLSSYARACASKGVFLIGWRDSVCEKYGGTCPPSQTFSYKHQRCQLTCRSLGSQQSCTSDFLPVDGCSCPEDHYLNEKEICVPKAKCPCYHNEGYIKAGKSASIRDEHCICTGGVLHCHSWRLQSALCPAPKVYFNCSTATVGQLGVQCAPTCLNLDNSDCDATECQSGCQCPSGLLEDGKGSCVKESDCPCQRNKRLYAPGKQIKNQCNTCTCRSGRWECTEEKCPETCIIYGSGHYSTFDERKYAFQGHCAYVAVKNNCGNKTAQHNFGVITENVPCGTTGTTCSKIVRIQLGRKEIKLSKGKYEEGDLDQGTDIPYKIRTAGLYLVVESSIGLAVMWDRRTTVRIFLETQHSGEVCGLCGNFDGDGENDFTTQGQLVVSSATEFANSWKLSSSCPDAEANVDPCVLKPHRHHWAKMMCSIITSDTFKDCRSLVDPLPFHDNCVKDSCSCDTGGDCECFCTAVAAYAQACSEAGVCVSWRTPEICPVFCDYYNSPGDCQWHYHPCHKPIYKTCLNPDGIILNPLPELEGCYPVCPEDKPIFDEEKNICVEACEISTTTTPTESTTSTTSTTTEESTTTTTSTTPPTESTTTEESTTTTASTTSPTQPTTTPTESTTTTASTTPPTQPTTTPTESTTTTTSTTPTTQPTTTPTESTTSTTSTTPPTESTTTEESTTTTASTTPPTQPTTTPTESTTTTTSTTPTTQPTTTPTESTTSTTSTTPPTESTTTEESTTTTASTTPPTQPTTTPTESTTTTTSTTPTTQPTTTPTESTTSTTSTTPPTESTTTEESTTTTTSTTPPTQPTTTPTESTTTTTSTTPPTQPTTTPTESTTTTASTTPPTQPTTTPTESTTTTTSTTPPTQSTTTEESTTTTASTTPPTQPTTTPTESTTTTASTTPPTQPTTTPTESTTSTTSTTPPTESTTTEESTTTTASTTPPTQPTTTPTESTTTTASTTPPTQPTTTPTESTTTTASTTPPTQPTTTPTESTTSTTSTTPPTESTTSEESTTTTTSTTPPTQPTTTPTESTTTTASTTPPTQPTTTPTESTTTTASTTPPTQPTTTPTESTTTTTSTTSPTQPTTIPTESTTTTASTTPPTQPTTTPTESTTTTTSTTPPTESTTTEESTTTTASTTPPTQPTTTLTESTTTTTSTTPTTQPTTTPTESTTSTTSTTPPTESTTTEESTTTTASTTPPTQPTTTPTEPTTTTTSTTPPTRPTTTPTESTTTTTSTTPPTRPTTTPQESTTTTTTSTTPPTESTTTEESTTTTASTTPPTQPTTTPTESTTTTTSTTPPTRPTTTPQESTTTTTTSTTPPTESTTSEESTTTIITPTNPPPICPEWNVTQNEIFFLCNCTMARCIENNTIEIIPYECPPLQNITCANGKKPVLVYDEHHCCQHYACDCACEGWGDPHYITFDGLYYSYQGNCTYVLMEEIIKRYDLKIYIDNVYCDPVERVSCPRSIIISYHSLKFRLINHNLMGAAQLEVLQHDARLKLPYSQYGVKIVDSGINLIFEIPHLRVVITFGIIGFSVDLPYQYFGRNTQGHCGTCNNNQMDDCMLPQGELVASCTAMADYWFAHNIAQPNCKVPPVLPTQPEPQPTVSQCTPDPICELLKTSVFEECHRFVSPDHFYQGCVFDSCRMSNPTVECISLQTYAAACAQSGVCIHWRNHTTICGSNCPANKVYKPCGPAEQPTCEDNPNEPHMNYTTEGCYCPDGMKLFNKESGVCVHKCGCLDPEGIPREFNEIFEYNFQECICEESTKTVTCKPKACPPQTVLSCPDPGFVLVNETDPSNLWCPRLVCQCQSNTCPVSNMKCPLGHIPSASVPEGKCCLEHTCEPKRVCVHKQVEYQPKSSVPANQCQNCTCTNEVDLKTGLLKINCDFLECKEDCDEGYEYVEDDTECCGKCVQTHCAFSFNGTNKLLMQGKTWSPPGNKCEHYTCIRVDKTLTTVSSRIVCPPFEQSNCHPDTIQTAADGCCTTCLEKEKACKVISMKKRILHNGCQSNQEVDIPYCEGRCNTFMKYSDAAAVMEHRCSCCKEVRHSNRTVDLHCMNGEVVPHTYMHVEQCGCNYTECFKPARRRRSITQFV